MCAPVLHAAEAPLVALVLSPADPGEIDTDSLLLALTVQLKPFRRSVTGAIWSRPQTLAEQRHLAERLGRERAASAVIWFTLKRKAEKKEVTVHVLELTGEAPSPTDLRSLAMGQPREGIERSMALGARTIVQAKLDHGAEPQTPKNAPSSARDEGAGARPGLSAAPGEGVLVGAGYGLELYPLGRGIRHGPDLHFSWLRGPLQGRLTLGYRFDQGGGDELSEWSSQVLRLSPSLAYVQALPRRLRLLVGLQAKIGILLSEARSRVDGRRESDNTSELALGARAGLIYAWGPRVLLELGFGVHWIPLRYQLLIRGVEQTFSGPLEFSLLPVLHVKLF